MRQEQLMRNNKFIVSLICLLKKAFKVACSSIHHLAALLNYISCITLGSLMLLVTLNVILRKVFKMPILGTYDWSGFLTVIVIGCGLAYCTLDNGHIEIGYFVDKFGQKARAWITTATRTLSFIVLSVYTYALFCYGNRLMEANEVSVTTKTPIGYFAYLLTFCFALFALTVLLQIVESAAKEHQRDT
jgi:TRAP-type C4-dicarboxylate transport system permease small subunit